MSNSLDEKLIEERAEIKNFDSRSDPNLPRGKQINSVEKTACGLKVLKSMKNHFRSKQKCY